MIYENYYRTRFNRSLMDSQPGLLTKQSLRLLDLLLGSSDSKLAMIIFDAFLKRTSALVHILLSKLEHGPQTGTSVDYSDGEIETELRYANFILWKFFSDMEQQICAEHICQSSEFTNAVLKLNSKTLSGNQERETLLISLTNELLPLIMLSLPFCDNIKVQLRNGRHLASIIEYLKKISSSDVAQMEEMVTTLLLNLQILYECVNSIEINHSLETQGIQSLKPLINSANNRVQLISKALVTHLNPADLYEVAALCSGEIQALISLFKNVMVESSSQVQVSLTNLLSITRDLLKIPSNQRELAINGAEETFVELSQNVTDDLQPYVHELIQIISGERDGTTTTDSCYVTVQSKADTVTDMGLKEEVTSHLHLDLQSLVKMDDGQATLADVTFKFVDTLLCYATEKSNGVSNMDVVIAFLIAADIVSQSSDEAQSVIIAKIAETPYIQGVVKNVCLSLQCDSGVPGEQCNFLLSLFVECVMQWTHFNSLLCKEFGKAGILPFLTKILCAYTKSKPPSEDEIEVLLQIFCALLNFGFDVANLPMFDSCNIIPVLLTFARCPHFESALLSRTLLSFLTPLLNYEQLPVLKLDEVDAAYFTSTLQQAMLSGDQEAEGFTIHELLKIITSFTKSCRGLPSSFEAHNQAEAKALTSEKSGKISRHLCEVAKHSKMLEENISLLIEADILSILEQHLRVTDIETTETALLLWNLLHHAPVKHIILREHPSIVPSLYAILKSPQNATQQEVLCALILLGSIEQSTDMGVQYAEACYKHGHYLECIELCNLILNMSRSEEQSTKTKLLKGKSLFHAYQAPLRFVTINKEGLSKREVKQLLDECFPYMKEAISLLGEMLEGHSLDAEGSKLLDLAMMDCIRETNQLDKCKRCLLCREQKELCRSHIWSESVIKQVSERKFGDQRAKNIMFGSEKHLLRTPGGVTCWMLCRKCEELLSQNGEKEYTSQFCSKVDMKEVTIDIPYTSWLYSFVVGILFRTMSTLIMHDCLNSDEVYNSFLLCRKHLFSLSVKMDGKLVVPSPIQEYQQSCFCIHALECLKPVVLVTPLGIAGDNELNMDYFSERHIDSGRIDASGLLHFFLTYCNGVMLLLQFEPSSFYLFPSAFQIQPTSGIYTVPSIEDWVHHIPSGIWSAIGDYQQFHLNSNLQISRHLSSKVAEKLNHKLPHLKPLAISDLFPTTSTLTAIPRAEISPEESNYAMETADVAECPTPSLSALESVCTCFLPLGFTVERTPQVKLNVSEDHQILLHTHAESQEHNMQITCFVGIGYFASFSLHKPYFIILQQSKEHSFMKADGVFFSIAVEDIKVDGYILDQGQNHPLQALRVPLVEFQELIVHLVPLMLEQQGHTNIHALLHLADCNRLLQHQCGALSLDYRCSPDGCWYCEDKCICCMKLAAPWTGVNTVNGGFCSRVCKDLFCGDPSGSLFPVLHSCDESRNTSFQLLETVRPPGASLNIIDSLHLCLGDGSSSHLPHGKPFIIWQIRKTNGQMFVSCFLDENCCPQKLVWGSQFELDNSPSLKLIESHQGHIKDRIFSVLTEQGFSDFHSWVSSTQESQ